MSTHTTITGRIGTEPEYKLLGDDQEQPAARFRLVYSPRIRDDRGDWTDGETTWYTVQAWGKLAGHVADRLTKGQTVTVTTTRPITARGWVDRNGEIQVDLTLTAADVALSMKFDQTTT